MKFRANGQRIHHARFAARLFVVGLARNRRKHKTKQHGRNDSAHFHCVLLTKSPSAAGRLQKICRFEAGSPSGER
jgi:hypothetical protein